MPFSPERMTPPSSRPKQEEVPEQESASSQLEQLEHDFLYKQLEVPYLRDRVNQLRQEFPGQPLSGPIAFEGALHQEKAEELYQSSRVFAAERIQKPLERITPEEMRSVYQEFPERVRLERLEQEAIECYDVSTKRIWSGMRVDSNDIRALGADVRMRRASRSEDPEERERGYQEADRTYRQLIEWTEDPGKKFEYEGVYLLRRWIHEADQDHVLEVRHALPREDMAEATDLVLTVGATQFDLQQKTLGADGYREEHHQEVLEKALKRTAETGSVLFIVDPQEMRELYMLTLLPEADLDRKKKMRRTSLRKKLINTIASATTPDLANLILGESTAESSTEQSTAKKLTEKFVESNSGVPQLVRFGLLESMQGVTPDRILAAKRALKERTAELRTILNQENWSNPSGEQIEQVRALFEQRKAA